ncbi:MAG TPA: hypothetical protein DGG94_18635 [Micromonosporaceae bacterium]|nr:hypothetical protein [Micromonosporaceae bacterium]
MAEAFEPIDGHADGLELESEAENRLDGSWTVWLRNASGWRYRVVIGLIEGLPETLMLERHAPGPHQPSSD